MKYIVDIKGEIEGDYEIIGKYEERLPEAFASAQPEIIRCKDCKYSHMTYNGECKYCDIWFPDEKMYLDGDYFCADAELRGEEE